MIHPTTQIRGEDCLSDLRFDRWLCGELTATEQSDARAHVDACARCSARLQEITRARRAYEQDPVALVAPGSARPRRHRRYYAAAGALALAACALLALLNPTSRDSLRSKGSAHAGFYVLRDGQVHRAAAGEELRPGDRVRFFIRSRTASYVAILSLDPAEQASVYFPAAARAQLVAAGSEQLLPVSVELDDTLGEERWYALYCREPVLVEPLRAQLQEQRGSWSPPGGCELQRIQVRKVAPR
jgi:Domain of unknown function (DUF4384)